MNKKEQLYLNYPLKIKGNGDEFISPELENNTSLPIIVTITSTYYSLALLCIKCLGGLAGKAGDDFILNSIRNTKMYFFLKRCLEKDPKKRYFLYL